MSAGSTDQLSAWLPCGFAGDTTRTLQAAIWLVNSEYQRGRADPLTDLQVFLDVLPIEAEVEPAQRSRELARLRALRSRLRVMLLAPRNQMVAHVNEALAEMPVTLHLVRHDGSDWHAHSLTDDTSLSQRVVVGTAIALIDVIRAREGSRIFVCADDACRAVALDLSRNRSKRYCSTICANRNAVASYRARGRKDA